jgi:hypothetical protein
VFSEWVVLNFCAIYPHTAKRMRLFVNRHAMAFAQELPCANQARGACSNNSDLQIQPSGSIDVVPRSLQ